MKRLNQKQTRILKCSVCGKDIIFKWLPTYYKARKNKGKCRSCGNKLKPKSAWNHMKNRPPLSEESRKKISNTLKNHTVSAETRAKISKIIKEKYKNPKYREKIKNSVINHFKSEEGKLTKEKISKSVKRFLSTEKGLEFRIRSRNLRIENIKKYHAVPTGLCPVVNSKACEIINEYGKQHNYNFQTASNGGEFFVDKLGYFLDGYDKEKNVAIEYNELHHIYGIQPKKDEVRRNKIINELQCRFIILQENTNGKLTELVIEKLEKDNYAKKPKIQNKENE